MSRNIGYCAILDIAISYILADVTLCSYRKFVKKCECDVSKWGPRLQLQDFCAIYSNKFSPSSPFFLKFKLICNLVQFIGTIIYSVILMTKSVSFVVILYGILKVYFSIIDVTLNSKRYSSFFKNLNYETRLHLSVSYLATACGLQVCLCCMPR